MCPPTFTAGDCAPGLECKHDPMIADAAGICIRPAPRENKYDLTFQATGCPNKNPSKAQVTWWKMQPDNKVFRDMYQYCILMRDRRASPKQIQRCCGRRKKCRVISCNMQSTWVL